MTDLELLDTFCETCLDFIDPFTFREITNRGLYQYVNFLPHNTIEAKAVIRARMAAHGKTFGDEEIDQIAGEVQRLFSLRALLVGSNMADAHKIIPVLEEMLTISNFILNYYKPYKF